MAMASMPEMRMGDPPPQDLRTLAVLRPELVQRETPGTPSSAPRATDELYLPQELRYHA